MVERRKHKRCGLGGEPVAVAFITNSSPHFVMAGRVTDIGYGGLALSHFGGRLPQRTSLELDIILSRGLGNIKKLMGDCSWDIEMRGELRARRCGIRFQNLTANQRAFVKYLIQKYARAGAES